LRSGLFNGQKSESLYGSLTLLQAYFLTGGSGSMMVELTTSFRDDKSGRHSSTTNQSRQTSILSRRPFCLEQLASFSYINRWSWTVSETIEDLLF